MSNKYSCAIYNKLLLFSMDIENAYGDDWSIEKLYFHFNKNSLEGKYIKPYMVKFIIHQRDKNGKIVDTEDCKWSLKDIYDNLNTIPLYLIRGLPKSTYGVVDITDKIYPVNNEEVLAPILPYEEMSYKFEYEFGSIAISDVIISEVEKMLTDGGIEFSIVGEDGDGEEVVKVMNVDGCEHGECEHSGEQQPQQLQQPKIKKYISIYGKYEDCEPSYKIYVSLDGKSYAESGYCVSPEPIDYTPYKSIGKFKLFSKKTVDAPNDEHLALITKCSECGANVICDWLSLKGTKCPYCGTTITI